MTTPKTIVVGKLARPYGLKGWINVYSFTEPSEKLFAYSPLFIEHAKQPEEVLSIENFKPQGDHWVLKLSTSRNRDMASSYNNKLIKVHATQLEPLPAGEYYWYELKGLTVVTQVGDVLGVIDSLFETGSNDVLVIKGKKTHYIPYHPQYVISVSLDDKKVIVVWDPNF